MFIFFICAGVLVYHIQNYSIEGFPSFFQAYALERTTDCDVYDLNERMKQVEESYIQKRETGKNRRGNKLPTEKAILQISFDEIGSYKDEFVLNDRVWLFFYDLWRQMGDSLFDGFLRELFSFQFIDYKKFEALAKNLKSV